MRVNIYIRKEDELKWKAIKDKPNFIHTVLKENPWPTTTKNPDIAAVGSASPIKLKATPKKQSNLDTCPHGLPWATCKVASCNIKGRNL